ncbi:glycosyltransferase family 2 protein [Spirosoma sp. BT702]|uniref:Glycosyltransferase family 2 protein n=1 Tax=Spirosoma profusum TaxID=2771354 RepID=A0A926Y0F9_9BACT|nr:glycosyltransferase family 2 protein [Spirosoma profusum]MBD2704304.1 glycosyltransferase family 2 protein [Spirosoma profusum]
MIVFYVFYLVFLGYILLNVLYWAVFAVAGRLGRADDTDTLPEPSSFRKIGVLIPAYKEDAVIIDSVTDNLKQQYPADRFDLIVIADSFQADTLAKLATLPIKVLEVSFEVSTVAKAINSALSRLPLEEYDILVVSDADNHMAPDFLSRINNAFAQGWKAIQGHRVAKNINTSVAILDAVSEEINNHIFRKGSRVLGLSSATIGSGMAFEPSLMKSAMATQRTMGGYDKELETNVVLSGHKIGYLEQAYIYDEKVAHRAVFQNQRTRWIAAQWQFVTLYLGRGIREIFSGRFASGFKVIQAIVLPKILLLGLLLLGLFIGMFTGISILWLLPLAFALVLGLSLVISVPAYLWKRISVREFLLIPMVLFSFVRALLNMRKAFKRFMHTPHTGSPNPQGS